jgi:hypothetical protein
VRAANYRLRFHIPMVRPGSYAFVIYLGYSGGRGGLAVDPFRYLLHVREAGSTASAAADADPGRTGPTAAWWIAGAAALFSLAAWMLRRRLAS